MHEKTILGDTYIPSLVTSHHVKVIKYLNYTFTGSAVSPTPTLFFTAVAICNTLSL